MNGGGGIIGDRIQIDGVRSGVGGDVSAGACMEAAAQGDDRAIDRIRFRASRCVQGGIEAAIRMDGVTAGA